MTTSREFMRGMSVASVMWVITISFLWVIGAEHNFIVYASQGRTWLWYVLFLLWLAQAILFFWKIWPTMLVRLIAKRHFYFPFKDWEE